MGDIAEMMLDGTLDSITGEYLGEATGFPRSIYDKPTITNPLNGIQNWLLKNNYNRTTTGVKWTVIMRRWAIECQNRSETMSNKEIAQFVSARFSLFKGWVRNNYKNK